MIHLQLAINVELHKDSPFGRLISCSIATSILQKRSTIELLHATGLRTDTEPNVICLFKHQSS